MTPPRSPILPTTNVTTEGNTMTAAEIPMPESIDELVAQMVKVRDKLK